MENTLTLGRLVRNVLLLAVLGFVVVQFWSKVLTAVGIILALALVGFLLYMPLHALIVGHEAPVRHSFARGLAWWRRCRSVAGVVRGKAVQGGVALRPFLVEIASGAALGALLLWARTAFEAEAEMVAAGAAAGGLLGAVVAWSRRQPAADHDAPVTE